MLNPPSSPTEVTRRSADPSEVDSALSAADFGGSEPAPSPEGPPWERYLAAILRYKWLILVVTVLGTVMGIVATRFVQLSYVAQSTLWIEVGQGETNRGPIREGQLLHSAAWLELLRSFTVLDHVVTSERLYFSSETPEDFSALAGLEVTEELRAGQYRVSVSPEGDEFELSTADGVPLERGMVGGPVGASVGLRWMPGADVLWPGRVLGFTALVPRDVSRALGEQLSTRMAENGNFITISLNGTDPARIAATINAVAERYVVVAAQLKRSKLDELSGILADQLRFAESNLRNAEMALEDFRIQTITLPTEQPTRVPGGVEVMRDPMFTNFFELKLTHEELRHDREAIERVLEEGATSPSSLDALATISSVANATELVGALALRVDKRSQLRALQLRYTDAYDPVRVLLGEVGQLETQAIPRLARELAAQIGRREDEAAQRIELASAELRAVPSRVIEEARLDRQVAIAAEIQAGLKQRYEVARLAAAGSVPDIRVLDRAVIPSTPTGDPRPMLFLGGLIGSFGLAVGGVLLLDRLDPKIRYPEQVAREMGVPVIGIVPHLRSAAGVPDPASTTAICEAFRQLRLSVATAHGLAGPIIFTVTSAEMGDGKSFISSNLALAFAQQGFRTLLVDGDIRRGRLHHLLGRDRTPGLTDCLTGTVRYNEVVQDTRLNNVWLIGSGTRMEIGPELLGSSAMRELLGRMRTEFDVIVMDSPPLGAGVDPYILAAATGNLLLVFRSGNTNRSFAAAKIQHLDRLPVRILGAVLNGVPDDQRAYRPYAYLPGYAAEDEAGVHSLQPAGAAAAIGQPRRALP